tara:strand:+ start:301 stop:714 length:414 start_codon:yes stop_codon:yes gene_type:complete
MSRFEKKELVKDLIIKALKSDTEGYMTVSDIAEYAFGDAYNVYTHKHLEDRVKRSIDRALGQLAGEGHITISLKNNKIKGNPIDRWKIASELDQADVANTLRRKVKRSNGFTDATQQLKDNAIGKGLLPDAELLKLK